MTRTIFAASALLALSAPAIAATPEAHSARISTQDLDLNSPAGRARLKVRVSRAADAVCGANDARGVTAHRAFSTCRAAAMRDALGE